MSGVEALFAEAAVGYLFEKGMQLVVEPLLEHATEQSYQHFGPYSKPYVISKHFLTDTSRVSILVNMFFIFHLIVLDSSFIEKIRKRTFP